MLFWNLFFQAAGFIVVVTVIGQLLASLATSSDNRA